MPSKANIAGHPIHPMLVPFPIAFFIMAFVADVVYEAGAAGSDWAQFAYILLIGGIATSLAAAMAGLVEYSVIGYVHSGVWEWGSSSPNLPRMGRGGSKERTRLMDL